MKIGKTSARRNILIDCGIHAREFISPATCLYIIDKVIHFLLLLLNDIHLVNRGSEQWKNISSINL